MSSSSYQLPSNFFSKKSLFTLSGAAGAVWLFCLVISAIVPPKVLSPYHWRLIALSFSELIAMLMVIQDINKSLIKWVIGFINGLLIFVNASGINAVSTGLAFENNDVSVKQSNNTLMSNKTYASLIIFKNEINWWPDRKLMQENENLKRENIKLVHENEKIKLKLDSVKLRHHFIKKDSTEQGNNEKVIHKIELLKTENKQLRVQLATLQHLSNVNNNINVESNSKLRKDLSDCQNMNAELNKKLNKIRNIEQLLRSSDKLGL